MTMAHCNYNGPIGSAAAGSSAPACSASVPDWAAAEIRATWRAARDAGNQLESFRLIERMVDRLGYGRTENNPSLVPNAGLDRQEEAKYDA